MAKTKSKQLASLLTFTTASIDVVSGSLIPDAANLYNIGSSTLPYNSGSFQNRIAAPKSYDGNHASASWEDLVLRYSFNDDKFVVNNNFEIIVISNF